MICEKVQERLSSRWSKWVLVDGVFVEGKGKFCYLRAKGERMECLLFIGFVV